MTYVDTSVILASLLAEDRRPPASFWDGQLISSRLSVYETWTRLHSKALGASHAEAAQALLGRLATTELASDVLARAKEPFPVPVRTPDALHLSTALFLRRFFPKLGLATYDQRLAAAATALEIEVETP